MRGIPEINHGIKKRYFSASEISVLIDEPLSTIYYWTQYFRIKRNQHQFRQFSRKAVAQLHIIKRMLRIDGKKSYQAKELLKEMFKRKTKNHEAETR